MLKKGNEMSKLIMVETLSQFRIRYVLEVPDDKTEFTLADVELRELDDEFSQKHLGEVLVGHREISYDEFFKLHDEDNGFESWTPEQKMQCIRKNVE
jgi:hypothetical protein